MSKGQYCESACRLLLLSVPSLQQLVAGLSQFSLGAFKVGRVNDPQNMTHSLWRAASNVFPVQLRLPCCLCLLPGSKDHAACLHASAEKWFCKADPWSEACCRAKS